ncbi:interleukin-like EMT inducer domain-containing protein [Anaerolineales bacterium HSG6]|nr:interleukin-like EMT inducer domain-containing protein [Anaerolineales bacterium HSG6]
MKRHAVILLSYLLLTIGLTWPLTAQLTTHIPGEATWAFDESTFIWNIWWFKHSLLALGQSPLQTSYTFFPVGVNLTTYTFNLFNSALALPLQVAFSLPTANNISLIFSYISAGYGMCLLSLYLLSDIDRPHKAGRFSVYLAAFLAGAVYAFSASRMMYVALGHYNFVTIQWFPFYALFLLKTMRTGYRPHAFLAALFAALCIYAELTYSVFLIFLTVILFVSEFLNRRMADSMPRGNISDDDTPPTSILPPPLSRLYPPNTPSPFMPIVRSLVGLLVMTIVAVLLVAPFIIQVLPDFLNPAYAEPGWGEGLKLSADLIGLVTVTPLHFLSGLDWITELRAVIEGKGQFSDANTLFLGYGILAVGLIGTMAYWRRVQAWLWGVIIFTVLSLGPLLTINGQNRFDLDGIEVTFPLPFAILHYIPVISANRVPNRFGIPLTLCLAVLVGYGVYWLFGKIGQTKEVPEFKTSQNHCDTLPPPSLPLLGGGAVSPLAGGTEGGRDSAQFGRFIFLELPNPQTVFVTMLLLTVLLLDQFSAPIPMTSAQIPTVYEQIGAETEPFTLMQLPLGWRNSYGTLGAERTQLQYYQSIHQRPMLGGNTSRNPAFKFDYFRQIPLFYALTETELYRPVDEPIMTQAKAQAGELMALYNIKYLVIHDPIPHRPPYKDTFAATQQLALDLIPHDPEPVYQSLGVRAFAVQQPDLPNPLTIDLGDWPSDPYRGHGWAGNEIIFSATANWITGHEAELYFPAQETALGEGLGDRQLTMQIAPFSYPGAPSQELTIMLNDQSTTLLNQTLQDGWQEVQVTLPETQLQLGLNRLYLHLSQTAQPRQVIPTDTIIGQTEHGVPTDIEANSGANFAFITLGFGDGAVDASAHRRGINVAVLDPHTGDLLHKQGFDTAANQYEAAALADFISQLPPDQIIIIASQGMDATAFFDETTWSALQRIGLNPDGLQPPFSAIGLTDAPPNTAQQASGEGTAYMRLGRLPDTRNLAAAVDWVTVGE